MVTARNSMLHRGTPIFSLGRNYCEYMTLALLLIIGEWGSPDLGAPEADCACTARFRGYNIRT